MKYTILFAVVGIILLLIPANVSQPSFNGTNPGCSGGSCHTFQDGIVTVSVNDLQVQVTVSGTTGQVAGELVDESGTVRDVNNGTNSNPFTLDAPEPGIYTINAGHKSPLRWDSASVNIVVTNLGKVTSKPEEFELYNNYPNPFNPSTTIRYSIPEASFTTLKIYNALGKEVAGLVNDIKSAGTYEVEFNASYLPGGIYFYTIQTGSFKETKKMILLK